MIVGGIYIDGAFKVSGRLSCPLKDWGDGGTSGHHRSKKVIREPQLLQHSKSEAPTMMAGPGYTNSGRFPHDFVTVAHRFPLIKRDR